MHEETTAVPGGDPIRGQIHLERVDVQRAMYEYQLVATGRYAVPFTIGALLYVSFIIVRSRDAGSALAWVPLFLVIGIIGAIFLGVRRVVNTVMENKTESERDITYELDEQGYTITTPSSSSRADWSSVHRTKESSSTFFIYPGETMMLFIPKRAFAERDVPRVGELLRARVTPRPTKNPAMRILILWVILIVAFLVIWYVFTPAAEPGPGPSPEREVLE